MKSNLRIISNLMIDDADIIPHHYLPGDFVGQVYPEKVDTRVIERELTPRQNREHLRYLVCTLCHKPCSGTCDT